MKPLRQLALHALIAASLLAAAAPAVHAHPPNASDASALSLLPIAISVSAPAMVLSAGAVLSVVAVEASADGAVWVLVRASDGARASLRLSGQLAGAMSVAAGTTVMVAAISTGWVLSAAGRAIAFIPNEIGKALLYNERVTL